LKKTISVPVGIVHASYGGARLRTFMSEDALAGPFEAPIR
jgi:hypothetical protein